MRILTVIFSTIVLNFLHIPTSSYSFAEEPLRIGATLPLTGDLATYGHLIRDGIELSVADLKKDNIDVVFIMKTSRCLGQQPLPPYAS